MLSRFLKNLSILKKFLFINFLVFLVIGLLTLIYFLILTPISLLSKWFKFQTDFNSKNNRNTTFKIQNKSFDKESFERAW